MSAQAQKRCGIWLHITSLNGNHGCGTIGKDAFRFIDLLFRSGISIWQILPVNPVRSIFNYSPYSPASSFAGNPLLIDETQLIREYALDPSLLDLFPDTGNAEHCLFPQREKALNTLLWLAYDKAFQITSAKEEYQTFLKHNAYWLEDYSLFETISSSLNSSDWRKWPSELAKRRSDSMHLFMLGNNRTIQWHYFVQFIFHQQWTRLKNHCLKNRLSLLGDIPIYTHFDSADVWANQTIFDIESQSLQANFVAGVPPDYFSAEGQLWGNPLYKWFDSDKLKNDTVAWWEKRFRRALDLYDMIRIDHFRAFESYWAVPATHKSAKDGFWLPGPGLAFFHEMNKRLMTPLPFIAEDLGIITDKVHALRDELKLPGMKIFQFAIDGNLNHPYLPHNLDTRPWFFYLGTHDNNTTRGWLENELSDHQRQFLNDYISTSDEKSEVWKMIDTALASSALTVMLSPCDLLELPKEARLNIPGKASGNWTWKLSGQKLDDVFGHLHGLCRKHHRSFMSCEKNSK